MNERLIVSTRSKSGSILRSEVWDTPEPLGLGYPFRWTLERIPGGVRIRDLVSLDVQEIDDAALENSQIAMPIALNDRLQLSIHAITDLNPNTQKNLTQTQLAEIAILPAEDPKDFQKMVARVSGGLVALLVLGQIANVLWPEQEKELIPPQFAKVILTPPAASSSAESSSSEMAESKAHPVNIVQTFKSQAVRKSTQSLLKASMVSLLAKSSPFSASASHAAINSLFSPSAQSRLLASNVKEATAGKLDMGTTKGAPGGVGYGSGEHAGVKGQGDSVVSLDSESSVDEGLTKDEVGKVIHAHISEVRYCYESAMIKNPDVQGKLVVNFVIHPKNEGGAVKTAKVNSSSLGDELLDQCIINRLTQWKFPKPRGGVEVAVAYPFIFKSLGK